MKVALDLRPLQIGHQNRGIGSYLLNIVEYFPKNDVEYVFIRHDKSNPIKEYGLDNGRKYKEIVIKKYDFEPRFLPFVKFIYGLITPKFLSLVFNKPDVFFQTDFLLGLPYKILCKKRVVTCYDLIPYRLKRMYIPTWQSFARLRQNSIKTRLIQSFRAAYYQFRYHRGLKTLKKADKILSISKTTTKDLVEIADIDNKKIETIYLAPSFRHISPNNSESIKLPINPYLFYLGGSDKRRQVHYLVSAFNKLNARGKKIDLVLAGNEFSGHYKDLRDDIKRAIDLSSYKKQIHLAGAIDENTKYQYIKNATALVFPSLYEGFGMPVIEAMRTGTPVISYKNSAIKEIGGDLIQYAAENSDGIRDAVVDLAVMKKQFLNDRLGSAIKLSSKFNWAYTADKTLKEIFRNTL